MAVSWPSFTPSVQVAPPEELDAALLDELEALDDEDDALLDDEDDALLELLEDEDEDDEDDALLELLEDDEDEDPLATHTLAVQVWLVPHSLLVTHCTQRPLPLQYDPPLDVHGVPALSGGKTGFPAEQAPVVQSLEGVGTSLSSTYDVVPPWPSHTTTWQSPGVCIAMAVPIIV
jgi:hypothetical protein